MCGSMGSELQSPDDLQEVYGRGRPGGYKRREWALAQSVIEGFRSDCQQIGAHPIERNASWMLARLSYRTRRRRKSRIPGTVVGYGIPGATDRKSTRLNSSHLVISYAVF